MNRQFDWASSLAFGDRAAEDVVTILRAQGHRVVDLTKLPPAQRRGVDYQLDDEFVDIKADTHLPVNVFLELECKDKPGCFFMSRADAWLYYFPKERCLYRLNLPALQHHVARNLARYRESAVTSASGANVWFAVGILVPLATLLEQGIATDLSPVLRQPNTEKGA